jgi:protein-S-isoprenylcysteine O-methyltransferase Ste14
VPGLFIFFLRAAAWLYGRFKGVGLVTFWIYRYSRHPQYLGFLLWSYGLLMFTSILGSPMGGLGAGYSLP